MSLSRLKGGDFSNFGLWRGGGFGLGFEGIVFGLREEVEWLQSLIRSLKEKGQRRLVCL